MKSSINPSKIGENPDRAIPSQPAHNAGGVETVADERSDFKGLLAGMLLGDGHVGYDGGRNARFSLTHGLRQAEYLNYKATLLRNLTAVNVYESNTKWGQVGCKTRRHPLYTRLREIAYPTGKLVLSRTWLNWLTVEGLAIFYMDDGSLRKQCAQTKGGKRMITHRSALLATCGHSLEENHLLRDFLEERFGIRFRVRADGKYWRLVCGAQEGNRLFALIEPHIHPSMRYKLDMQYRKPDEGHPDMG